MAVQLGGRIVVWTASGFGMAGELRSCVGSFADRAARGNELRAEQNKNGAVPWPPKIPRWLVIGFPKEGRRDIPVACQQGRIIYRRCDAAREARKVPGRL